MIKEDGLDKYILIGLFILSIVLLISGKLYYDWWYATAPYCCTHMCGQTMSYSDCSGSLIGATLFISGFGCLVAFAYCTVRKILESRNKLKD